jgi:hypothetical protein
MYLFVTLSSFFYIPGILVTFCSNKVLEAKIKSIECYFTQISSLGFSGILKGGGKAKSTFHGQTIQIKCANSLVKLLQLSLGL